MSDELFNCFKDRDISKQLENLAKMSFHPQRDWTPRTPATVVMENRDTDTSYTKQDKEEYKAHKASSVTEEGDIA